MFILLELFNRIVNAQRFMINKRIHSRYTRKREYFNRNEFYWPFPEFFFHRPHYVLDQFRLGKEIFIVNCKIFDWIFVSFFPAHSLLNRLKKKGFPDWKSHIWHFETYFQSSTPMEKINQAHALFLHLFFLNLMNFSIDENNFWHSRYIDFYIDIIWKILKTSILKPFGVAGNSSQNAFHFEYKANKLPLSRQKSWKCNRSNRFGSDKPHHFIWASKLSFFTFNIDDDSSYR